MPPHSHNVNTKIRSNIELILDEGKGKDFLKSEVVDIAESLCLTC